MTDDNQRITYRVPFNVRAELFYHGLVLPCLIINMSAGGMLLAAELEEVQAGEQLTLGLRLFDELADAAGLDYLNFQLEVLEVLNDSEADVRACQLRCRNRTSEGSSAYERAHKVVFEAERQRLGAHSGMDSASPMVSDPGRREALRQADDKRWSKGSVNPLLQD